MSEFKHQFTIDRERILVEDALKHIYKAVEDRLSATTDSVAGALSIRRSAAQELLSRMSTGGLIHIENHACTLTEEGRQYALHVIRAHRLYETYLAHETGIKETAWHQKAEHAEHHLTNEDLNQLADRMGNPRYDPHGDPIPTREGSLEPVQGKSLAEWPVGEDAVIVHVEDEPLKIFEEISAAQIAAGMNVKVLSTEGDIFHLVVDGHSVPLRKACAENVHVDSPALQNQYPKDVARLSTLKKGTIANIVGISPLCRGAERRRLLDLGIVPGSKIELDYTSPFHSPMAYLVRGTLIALRKEQADLILITRN